MAIDLVIFMGQSNMAGRGEYEHAVTCSEKAGLEYRAVTAPDRLCPVVEPFGKEENVKGGIDDDTRKSGGMVSALVVRYHELTGRCIIAVSASEGGTSLQQWHERLLWDAVNRLQKAQKYLQEQNIEISHTYMVWCQGETDGDHKTTAQQYQEKFLRLWNIMHEKGIERCFMIQIGHFNYRKHPGSRQDADYEVIRQAQAHICHDYENVIMAGTFNSYLTDMKDTYHYHQTAYTQVGQCVAEVMAQKIKEE